MKLEFKITIIVILFGVWMFCCSEYHKAWGEEPKIDERWGTVITLKELDSIGGKLRHKGFPAFIRVETKCDGVVRYYPREEDAHNTTTVPNDEHSGGGKCYILKHIDGEPTDSMLYHGVFYWHKSGITKNVIEVEVSCPDKEPCPYRHMSVPEKEVVKWLDEGWEFVKCYSVVIQDSGATDYSTRAGYTTNWVIIKKRVCE